MRLFSLSKTRFRPRALAVGLAGLILAGSGSMIPAHAATADRAPVAAGRVSDNPIKFVAQMQPGFNVGNSLDAIPTETSWGNPLISQDLLLKLKSLGYKSIRLPVTWDAHEGAAPGYTVDPTWMARVKQVVDWALADGFYVVVNVHHDSWEWITNMPTDPTGVTARYEATWTQIADEFKNESRKLVFEADNEQSFSGVTDAQGETLLNELQTDFFNVVRQSGGENATRYLMLSTLGDSAVQADDDALYAEIESLHDPYLIASFHYYGFWPFGVNIAGYSSFDATSQQDMVNAFTLMHNEFVAKGIPVYAGEVGLYNDYNGFNGLERGETLKYYEMLGYEARATGITVSYWDDGGRIINRNTLQLLDPGTFAVMQSSWFGRSGTASSDTVYVPKTAPIADESLTLNLNGLAFTGLSDNGKRLKAGRDYTVSGDQLTLKAALLTKLVGSQAYGVNATLEADFSCGLPWQINVVTNAQPVLAAATGTTSADLTVPTQFNGDTLTTMSSVYADGTDAGTTTWTAYQAYGTTAQGGAYAADYTDGNIVLTKAYLASLTDGKQVTITFHFWSGATATYYVTVNSGTVTATLS
ncbi:MAG TPA: cellulase family glycosylhydrolase [Actinospica sp.]|nr:cellulase family glycosylhydrolase [Actinospica sp.]